MIPILRKEFIVQRTLILFYAAATLIFAAQFIPVDEPLPIITILAVFFTFGTAAHEDKNNSHVLLNSLPVSRKEIVAAKYAFHILIGIGFVVLAAVCKIVAGGMPAGAALEQSVAAATVVVLFVSVFFPMYFWLGPRFVQIGMIVLFILMFAAVPMVYNLGAKHGFWGIPVAVRSFPDFLLLALLAIAAILFLFVSRLVSVRLYERKQF